MSERTPTVSVPEFLSVISAVLEAINPGRYISLVAILSQPAVRLPEQTRIRQPRHHSTSDSNACGPRIRISCRKIARGIRIRYSKTYQLKAMLKYPIPPESSALNKFYLCGLSMSAQCAVCACAPVSLEIRMKMHKILVSRLRTFPYELVMRTRCTRPRRNQPLTR